MAMPNLMPRNAGKDAPAAPFSVDAAHQAAPAASTPAAPAAAAPPNYSYERDEFGRELFPQPGYGTC
jgi:hypothetical protein